MFDNQKILITGGTGSFGQAFVRFFLENHRPDRLVIFSRDEQKHYQMQQEISPSEYPVEYVVGDVRDREKILTAMTNMDLVVHSAAMKHMPMAEDHPLEAVKTNILGTQNVIDACIAQGVKKAVALSTDKAVLPINTYGATKLLLESLFVSANQESRNTCTTFTAVRYANVFGSKGSVIPLFQKLKATGVLPITDPDMSRFSISMQQSIDLVVCALSSCLGGEIVVPIAPSYRVGDIAEAIGPNCEKRIIGARKREKMHEKMISGDEMSRSIATDDFFFVTPEGGRHNLDDYLNHHNARLIQGFNDYSSETNTHWLNIDQIRDML